MELANKKHDDLWTARKIPTKTHAQKMEIYMSNHIRTMTNPNWKTEAWYPENQLCEKLHQSTMESWLTKTQIMTMMTQKKDDQKIHPRDCIAMLMPRVKLQQQRKQRNQAIQEQETTKQWEIKDDRTNHTSKRQKGGKNTVRSSTPRHSGRNETKPR